MGAKVRSAREGCDWILEMASVSVDSAAELLGTVQADASARECFNGCQMLLLECRVCGAP